MKRIALLLIAVAFASCQQEKKDAAAGEQPFFVFDKVVHYHKDVTKTGLDSLYDKEEKTRNDLGLIQIVSGNVPTSPRDTLFVNNMDILEFSKHEVDASKNAELSKIFSQKTSDLEADKNDCKPLYTDVLIFREKGKIVGVAKLDFECKRQQMVGMRYPPQTFGKNGEYEELKKLLSN